MGAGILAGGAIAQLGERLPRTEEVVGSNPIRSTICSTTLHPLKPWPEASDFDLRSIQLALSVESLGRRDKADARRIELRGVRSRAGG